MKQEYLNCKESLYARINQYKLDNNIKKLGLNSKDPHVQELIESVSFVQGALKYEINNLGNSLYETLLINLGLVTYLPHRIISSGSTDKLTFIPHGTLVKGNGYYWRTIEDTYISPFVIFNKEIIKKDNEYYLNITLDWVNSEEEIPLKNIDLLMDEYLIDSIFAAGLNVKAKIWNREEYYTYCDCSFLMPQDATMDDYDHLNEQFHRIRISNMDAIKSRFILSIPLNNIHFMTTNNIVINPLILENKYEYIVNLDVPTEGRYQLDLIGQDLLGINKIQLNQETIVPSLMDHIDGWYILPENSLYFQQAYEEALTVFAMVSDKNVEFGNYDLLFQEYNEVRLTPMITGSKSKYLYEQNHIKYIIQYLKQCSLREFFQYYVNHYGLNLEVLHEEYKIIPYRENNYVINKVLTLIHYRTQDSIIKNYIFFRTLNRRFPLEFKVTNKYGLNLHFEN